MDTLERIRHYQHNIFEHVLKNQKLQCETQRQRHIKKNIFLSVVVEEKSTVCFLISCILLFPVYYFLYIIIILYTHMHVCLRGKQKIIFRNKNIILKISKKNKYLKNIFLQVLYRS